MHDPNEPAERRPQASAPPRLERAPGERYRAPAIAQAAATGRAPDARRGILGAIGAGALGAIVLFGLGLLDLDAGLIAVAAAIGWVVALAMLASGGRFWTGSRRAGLAGVVAGIAVTAGLGIVWAWSRTEGGVLGPVDYLVERFGPLAAVDVVAAVIVAALRARA